MKIFAKIAVLLFAVTKSFILDVRLGSECVSVSVFLNPTNDSENRKSTAKLDFINFLLLLQPNERWNNGKCEICKCFNGKISCGKICDINQCQSGFELVFPKDQCCYCRRIGKYNF